MQPSSREAFPYLWKGKKKSRAVSQADTDAAEYLQKIYGGVRSKIWNITSDGGSLHQKEPNQLLQSSLSRTATSSEIDTHSGLHAALCLRKLVSSQICSRLFFFFYR